MKGRQRGGQEHLFYSFDLESVIPQKHLLRGIERCLELADLRQHLAEYYSHTGRPSIDPELMIRMLIVGYCYGIRSERRLCEEVHLNLAYRWLCRLGLEDTLPNHSTFSKNRHGRFRESDTFHWVFDKVVRAFMVAGLVKGEGFAVDASIIEAEAGSKLAMPGDEHHVWQNPVHCKRAVRNSGRDHPQAHFTCRPAIQLDGRSRRARLLCLFMVERVEANFNITPQRLIGDTACGTAPMLA